MKKGIGRTSLKGLPAMTFILLVGAAWILCGAAVPTGAVGAAETVKGISGPVDINTATVAELEGIKGVGPVTAKKIVEGRPYKSKDELTRAGLSAKAVEAIKPFVTVGKAPAAKSPSPVTAAASDLTKAGKEVKTAAKAAPSARPAPGTRVNINTADKAALEALPEIGPAKAQAIIDGRPYKTVEDVMKVSGIKEKTFAAIKDYIVVR